jgi:hypothetical protein
MDKWVLTQLDPIKLSLIGLLIGHQQKPKLSGKKKKKKSIGFKGILVNFKVLGVFLSF